MRRSLRFDIFYSRPPAEMLNGRQKRVQRRGKSAAGSAGIVNAKCPSWNHTKMLKGRFTRTLRGESPPFVISFLHYGIAPIVVIVANAPFKAVTIPSSALLPSEICPSPGLVRQVVYAKDFAKTSFEVALRLWRQLRIHQTKHAVVQVVRRCPKGSDPSVYASLYMLSACSCQNLLPFRHR